MSNTEIVTVGVDTKRKLIGFAEPKKVRQEAL